MRRENLVKGRSQALEFRVDGGGLSTEEPCERTGLVELRSDKKPDRRILLAVLGEVDLEATVADRSVDHPTAIPPVVELRNREFAVAQPALECSGESGAGRMIELGVRRKGGDKGRVRNRCHGL
jgi:hypothetical protein